jgi:hypothetical protein
MEAGLAIRIDHRSYKEQQLDLIPSRKIGLSRERQKTQFQTAYLKVTTSPELVPLGQDDQGRQRFTTREMFNLEPNLFKDADTLAHRDQHAVDPKRRARILAKHHLSPEQERAALEVTSKGDLKSLAGRVALSASVAMPS